MSNKRFHSNSSYLRFSFVVLLSAFSHTISAQQLSLVKEVLNDHGGVATATDWTLSAVGPITISGPGGVAPTSVDAGVYTLSESSGPPGYTAGAWSCSGGILNGARLTLAAGDIVICTIRNNDDVTVCPAGPPTCNFTSPEFAVSDVSVKSGETINVLKDTYVLAGTLQINKSLTIEGNDSVFDANGNRAINVFGASTNVNLHKLTIRNGQPYHGFGGGALWVSGGATAIVRGGIFENNQAEFGGAIHNIGSTVAIYNSEFFGNRATVGEGGAILTDSGGFTQLFWVAIDGSAASVAGGALAARDIDSFVYISNSTISNNGALISASNSARRDTSATISCGGGPLGQTFAAEAPALSAFQFDIRLDGPDGDLNVIPSDLSILGRVRQDGPGGAIIATASAFVPGGTWPGGSTQTLMFVLDDAVALIPDNTYAIETFITGAYGIFTSRVDDPPIVSPAPPPIDPPYPGGDRYDCSGSFVLDSDFTFRTFGVTPGDGGGIFVAASSTAFLNSSTVSGNAGDGITVTPDSAVQTASSTITNNSGNGFTAQPSETFGLGGSFASTIMAGNGGNDCDGSNFVSYGYNLIGDNGNCFFTESTGDLIGTTGSPIDPLLGPLQDNGGFTRTHAIDQDSPALDAAGSTPEDDCAGFDQRDVARPIGPACDIGAVELARPLQDLIDDSDESAVIDVPDGIYHERITIGDNKTLRPLGPGNVVIDAGNLGASGPVISATGDFALEGILVTGGSSPDNGGGIKALGDDIDIALSNVVFDDNDAVESGGAIYIQNGTINATDVTFTNNSANEGGAIHSSAPLKSGEVIDGNTEFLEIFLSDVVFDNNDAVSSGGAIFMQIGKLEGTNVTFTDNSANEGGALRNIDSWIEFEASEFSSNIANVGNGSAALTDTGGVDGPGHGGQTILRDSTVDSNVSLLNGSTLAVTGFRAQLNLVRSTVSNNHALEGPINTVLVSTGGDVFMHTSTVSGNSGVGIEVGTSGWNGSSSVLQAYFSTVTNNSAGFHVLDGGYVEFEHSIIAGNGSSDCIGSFFSSGYNLIGDNTNCEVTESAGDLIGVSSDPIDPLLGDLQDNGGFTFTHSIAPNSPAVNAGGTNSDEGCFASVDQRNVGRPIGPACDIGAYEALAGPLVLGSVWLGTGNINQQDLEWWLSYPGVVDVPIIDIPIENLTGDTFNSPESAPLGSFPIGSFPIGSFELRNSPIGSFPIGSFPIGSFPIGSFPIGSFPIGSFPLSSIPLKSAGGWTEVLNGIPELAGAPLQTVTLEQLLTHSSFPGSVAGIELRDLSIQGSPLGSFSLPGLALGATTVAELDQWAGVNSGETGAVCATLTGKDPTFSDCGADDTLLSLEFKGAPVSALSLSSLPLGSFPIGSFPIGSFPIGSFPLGSFPIGSFPIGSFPIGSFPIGSFSIGSFPIGSFNLLAAPIGSFPLGSFPIGSFPIGSFEIDGKPFCVFFDEQTPADASDTCAALGLDITSATLEDVLQELSDNGSSNVGSTPIGSFPLGSFPIGSFPIGSFSLETVQLPPLSLLTLAEFSGCEGVVSGDCTTLEGLPDTTSLVDIATSYGSLAASPLGSFPIGSFDVTGLLMGTFPIGSFEVNGTPIGSFPLGSFDLINSPIGSFPIGSFTAVINDPDNACAECQTLADASREGVIKDSATLSDLSPSTEFDNTTFGTVLDAMTLAMLYGPGTLADIEDTGNLTLGQLLIAMMLKTDFPWETIPLDQLDAQKFSADNFRAYGVDFELSGTGSKEIVVSTTISDGNLYVEGSTKLYSRVEFDYLPIGPVADPDIVNNGDGTQTLSFDLNLTGYRLTNYWMPFEVVPPMALGTYDATASVQLGLDTDPDVYSVSADNSDAQVSVIPDPSTDPPPDVEAPPGPVTAPPDVLLLGFIDTPDDDDFFLVVPPAAGNRVAVFMANPASDNDLIMYEPVSTVEAKGQTVESSALDSVPFEDDGVNFGNNLTEEPNALEDVNLAIAPLASISTNRSGIDESVSAVAGNTAAFTIQVSGYNGATSQEPYTLRVKVTPEVPTPQCTARSWLAVGSSTVFEPEDSWMPDTNTVFLVNWERLAASDPGGAAAADDALNAINNLVNAPGITNGVVVDVSTISGVDYTDWDDNPCDAKAANAIVNAITQYLEVQRATYPNLAYVTIVGSDEVIPFARKPDETSIANESNYAGEFSDNAMYGALVTRHFLSDDTYGDIDPIAWLDRYLNVPELGVGRLVESAADIVIAADNYVLSGGILDPQTALSAGYDFVADAAQDIDDTFNFYGPVLGFNAETALIDPPGITPETRAWNKSDFLRAAGISGDDPVDLVSFNMHFDFDEALPSIGDATGNYTDNLINATDLAGSDLTGGIWFTVGCHSGSSVADVSVVGSPSEDWAQTFGRQGALYLAQNAYGLGDTEAIALTERLMANFARNLNGSLSIGQAHVFAKQQYFADLGLYGEYDYKALQAATLFGLPMYRYGNGAMVVDPLPTVLPVTTDPLSGLASASWSLTDTGITQTTTDSKGELFSVDGEVQFVHFRPLQPIVRRDVTGPNGETASGAFLTELTTEDIAVTDIAFARPVIDLGENEPEIEWDEGVFPTAFTNIASFKAPPGPLTLGPFEARQQLNVIVGQFISPLDGSSSGTERLFRNFATQVFYRPAPSAPIALASSGTGDFIRPEFDNVQASVVGEGSAQQAAFSVDVFDEATVLRVAVLYLQSVTNGKGNWVLADLVKGSGNGAGGYTWTGGGPVDLSGIANDQISYMVQAVDDNGNVANSTFKGLFYVAKTIPSAPDGTGENDPFEVVLTDPDDQNIPPAELDNDDWQQMDSVLVTVNGDVTYEYSVDGSRPLLPLTSAGFIVSGDGIHIVEVFGSDGSYETFVVLIDNTEPEIVISTPADGSYVVQGLAPPAEYECRDSGSGIASCIGDVANGVTVPDGIPIPGPIPVAKTFSVSATDNAGLESSLTNSYFVVEQLDIDGPDDPELIGTLTSITATATVNLGVVQYAIVEWGDGTTSEALVDVSQPGNIFTATHEYMNPGVYRITVRIDDGGAYVQTGVFEYAVIYDPSGGFVTGGGWIDSPAGAYTSDPALTGKAHFGFVSKYKKGQSVPDGSTNFRFAAGDLEFDATVYEWMIITKDRALYKGEGTVNDGAELHKFQVTARDADVSSSGITEDAFRIKIWLEDDGGIETVLYDNGLGADSAGGDDGTTALGGGSITVHAVKKK